MAYIAIEMSQKTFQIIFQNIYSSDAFLTKQSRCNFIFIYTSELFSHTTNTYIYKTKTSAKCEKQKSYERGRDLQLLHENEK